MSRSFSHDPNFSNEDALGFIEERERENSDFVKLLDDEKGGEDEINEKERANSITEKMWTKVVNKYTFFNVRLIVVLLLPSGLCRTIRTLCCCGNQWWNPILGFELLYLLL